MVESSFYLDDTDVVLDISNVQQFQKMSEVLYSKNMSDIDRLVMLMIDWYDIHIVKPFTEPGGCL